MPTIAELLNATTNRRPGVAKSGAAVAKAQARGSPIVTTITVQGAYATAQHFAAVAALVEPLTRAVIATSGSFLANLAAEIHQPHIDTGDTYRSINAGVELSPTREAVVHESDGEFWVDVGPTTPQSLFLEWGFLHPSGRWIQYPFMLPAADQVAPMFENAMFQVASVADQLRVGTGPIGSSINGALHSFRNFLYSYSQFAGDIQAITGFTGLSASRGYALQAARASGDLEASMRGAIGTRIVHRAVGRFASGSLSTVRSAVISGPSSQFTSSAQRIYNRVVGRGFGLGLRFTS